MSDAPADTTTGQWREALSLFETWLAGSDEAKVRLIDRVREKTPDLHRRLQALIRADAEAHAQRFLARDALADVGREDAREGPDNFELGGQRLGPWKLERPIGAGGMGQVWLARRDDGLYEGDVAIKMLRVAIADSGANQRFAREGQFLARLTHPHIARLLDAGFTSAGQRYLVLEYVIGERLDRWCDECKLSIDARIGLFLQVCSAVSHAHANLVVHRDLKPSNILVQDDGQAKLLDFGVAKLLDATQDDAPTQLTALAGAALTPEYAAPEQLSGAPITIATDVYSLGVILYGLLCGQPPYGNDGESPLQRARHVVDTEPVRLSEGVEKAGDAAAAIAERRSTSPERLRRNLSGDLETIVGKALKKDPRQRYPSVDAMAQDLKRYLAHEPISARPDTLGYRARMFVSRNRLAVMLASVALIGVIGGAGVAAWQAHEARQKAAIAQAEAAKADAVKQFLLGLFEANSTEKSGPQAQNTTARELLDLGSRQIEAQLKDQPEIRAEVLAMLSEMYWQLGQFDRSGDMDGKRVALMRTLKTIPPEELADALYNYAQTLDQLERKAEAIASVGEALQILDAAGKRESELYSRVLQERGNNRRSDAPREALADLQASFDLLLRKFPSSLGLSGAITSLSVVYDGLGRLDDAQRVLTQGGEALRAHQSGNRVGLANFQATLALHVSNSYRFGDALRAHEEAWRLHVAANGPTHNETQAARANYAALLGRRGDMALGLSHLDAIIAAMPDDPHGRMLSRIWGRPWLYKAALLADAGDPAGANAALDRIDWLFAEELAGTAFFPRMLLVRAEARRLEGRNADALALARRAQVATQEQGAPCVVEGWQVDAVLAGMLQVNGEDDTARPLIAAIDACQGGGIDDTVLRVAALRLWATDALHRNQYSVARERADAALDRIARSSDRAFYALDEAELQRIASAALAKQGNTREARERQETAIAILDHRQVPTSPTLKEARAVLAALR